MISSWQQVAESSRLQGFAHRRIVAAPSSSHVVIACGIALVHGLLWTFSQHVFLEVPVASAEQSASVLVDGLRAQSPEWDTSPLPEVQPALVRVHTDALESIQFELEEEGEQEGIIAPSSAPRLNRFQSVNVEDFARRAGVTPNQPITIVVALEILRDGSVGTVDVVRSCGDLEKDGVAVSYARRLQWTAGTVDQKPRVMRVQFPVTLAVRPLRPASGLQSPPRPDFART